MRVMVTGGTGFLGSHAVSALVKAGHEVRLLVRSPDRIAQALAPHGIGAVDHVSGDITDTDSIARALQGCDAALHVASVLTTDPRRAGEMLDVNPRGTRNVLEAAHALGLDPIIQVSSNAALMPSSAVLTPTSPLGNPPGAYSQSKVEAERIAREFQARGAPVVIVRPTGILGPHDPHFGEFTTAARDTLSRKMPLVPAGAAAVVDVRDVGAVFAALMKPGGGPRSYMANGGYVSLKDFATEAERLTGQRIPAVELPGQMMLAAAGFADVLSRTIGVHFPMTREGVWFMVHGCKIDTSATEADLGVKFRPMSQTLEDQYRWLLEAGHVDKKYGGRLLQ